MATRPVLSSHLVCRAGMCEHMEKPCPACSSPGCPAQWRLFQSTGGMMWPRSGFSLNFTLSLKCLWFQCEMTGAVAGQPCGASYGRGSGKRGCPHLHSWACSDRAEMPICPCRRAAGGACEVYPGGPGSSGVDSALGPSALVSLSLL